MAVAVPLQRPGDDHVPRSTVEDLPADNAGKLLRSRQRLKKLGF